jgi:hypothetical protein
MKHRFPPLLTAICTFGFLLRFFAISHGVGYHPDERGIIMMTESLTWESPFPRSFAYGSLPFYLLKGFSETASFLWPQAVTYDGLFYTGRFINALISVWLINATFRLGVTLFNRLSVGYWGAFLIATNTFVLQNSHFFTVDILLTTLNLEGLIAMALIAERGKWRHYLIAAITIGLALATKIGALTLLAPASLAFIIHRFQFRENPLPVLLIMGGIGVFMVGSHLLGGAFIGLGLISIIILNFFRLPVTSSWQGWRYLLVCAPLIAISGAQTSRFGIAFAQRGGALSSPCYFQSDSSLMWGEKSRWSGESSILARIPFNTRALYPSFILSRRHSGLPLDLSQLCWLFRESFWN